MADLDLTVTLGEEVVLVFGVEVEWVVDLLLLGHHLHLALQREV
jgi:hypothetical protein